MCDIMIELRGVSKAYYMKRNMSRARIVLDNINLKIEDHEFVCIIGPSDAERQLH